MLKASFKAFATDSRRGTALKPDALANRCTKDSSASIVRCFVLSVFLGTTAERILSGSGSGIFLDGGVKPTPGRNLFASSRRSVRLQTRSSRRVTGCCASRSSSGQSVTKTSQSRSRSVSVGTRNCSGSRSRLRNSRIRSRQNPWIVPK